MAFADSKNARLYIGSFDLSSYTKEIGVNMSPKVLEVTCFGDTGAKFVRGHSEDKLSWSGYYDAATTAASEAAMNDLRDATAVRIITAWPEGGTIGNVGYGAGSGWLVGPDVVASVGNAVALSGELNLGSYDRIVSCGTKVTTTAGGTPMGSQDDGASSLNGGVLYFQVFNASASGGSASWNVYIMSAATAEMSSGTIHGLTSVATATALRTTFTGTFHRYVELVVGLDAASGGITLHASYMRS